MEVAGLAVFLSIVLVNNLINKVWLGVFFGPSKEHVFDQMGKPLKIGGIWLWACVYIKWDEGLACLILGINQQNFYSKNISSSKLMIHHQGLRNQLLFWFLFYMVFFLS